MASSTSGSSDGEESDDVTMTSSCRTTRRVYDWNTKLHFYPDFIDSDTADWCTMGRLVRWHSARSSRQHDGLSWSSCVEQQPTTTASTVQVGGGHPISPSCTGTSRTVVLCSPFRRRSQFLSQSWSEKRGRHGAGGARTPAHRRPRRRLSDPVTELVDDWNRSHTTGEAVKAVDVFCRSDWKRQVSTARTKDVGGAGTGSRNGPAHHGVVGSARWTQLKQISSVERARRRREFVRQRCRRFGWEPFGLQRDKDSQEDMMMMSGQLEDEGCQCDSKYTEDSMGYTACPQTAEGETESRESLPEIVVDHQRPSAAVVACLTPTATTSITDGERNTGETTPQRRISSQKLGDVLASPTNEYDYVLHKFHHAEQQRHQPQQASTDKPTGKPSPASGTIIALLARTPNTVRDDPPRSHSLDQHRGIVSPSNTVSDHRLSNKVSNKFTDNFQLEMTTETDQQSFTRCFQDPIILRSSVKDEVKENIEPPRPSKHLTQKQPTSAVHLKHRLPATTVFTVTGCPRTAAGEHDSGSVTQAREHSNAAEKTGQSTTSLDRRRPIVALPDVEQAIEVDNFRRYWYISERCSVPSQQCQRPAPSLPPRRQASPTHQPTAPPRSRSCEFRREYELQSEYQNAAAILQLQTSPQDAPRSRSTVDKDETVPYNAGMLSSIQRTASAARIKPVDGRHELKSPQTVCHVSVTVLHKSPRPGQGPATDLLPGDETPPPALRRTGIPPKYSSPVRRRVTFSDERRPMYAWTLPPRCQQNSMGQAALDTLWHYHETYPWMESQHTGLIQTNVKQLADETLPKEAPGRTENEIESMKQQLGDAMKPRCDGLAVDDSSYSPSYDDENDDGDEQNHQQGSRDADGTGVDQLQELEATSLSLRELVTSFESMASPYMRAPLVSTRRACTSE